jgi:peptidoglycan-associated lipoprotein
MSAAYKIPGGVVIPAPTVTLAATPASVNKGLCSTLSWGSTNATTVSIDQGVGVVATTGTKSVCPTVTTTYLITATGAGGTKTAAVTVIVIVPPVVTPGCNPPTGITIKQ